jgi:WD40 repeat protein
VTTTLDTPLDTPVELPETPYVGLVPFDERDAPFFFGRERERRLIAGNLIASRLTLIYGASGVGKSSLLRAGVAHDVHRLAARELALGRVPESILVVFSSWRDPPLPLLAKAIEDAVTETLGELAPEPPSPTEHLDELLAEWVRRIDAVPAAVDVERRTRLLIVCDQFEEYFLYQWHDQDKGSLGEELPRAINREGLRANFALSIREDAYSQLDRFKGRIPNLFDNYLRVRHLDHEAGRRAIRLPVLETWNGLLPRGATPYSIEDELVEEVLRLKVVLGQTGGGSVGESTDWHVEAPYLQLVMRRLWLETVAAGEHRLTFARLGELGGAEAIVRSHLLDAMEKLEPHQRDIAARIFHQLVTPEGTKIAHTIGALREYAGVDTDELAPVLKTLSDTRILRPVDPPVGQSTPRYEIYHDVLAAPILDWHGRHEQAQEQQRLADQLTRQKEEATRQRSAARRFRAVAGAAAVLAVAAVTLAVWALRAQDKATKEKNAAKASQDVIRAGTLLATDPARALNLALKSTRAEPHNQQALNLLRQAALSSHLLAVLRRGPERVIGAAFAGRTSRLVTVRATGTVDLWDVRAGKWLRSLHDPHPASGRLRAVFSSDGRRLAVEHFSSGLYSAKAVTVWDTVRGRRLASLPLAQTVLALSPDGRLLASGLRPRDVYPRPPSFASPIRLWLISPTGLHALRPLKLKYVRPEALAFSPDGTSLTATSVFGIGQIWNRRTGRTVDLGPSANQSPFKAYALQAVYSRDGNLVANLTEEGIVQAFEVRTGRFLEAKKMGSGATSISAGPGNSFALAGRDRTALIWNPLRHKQISLKGHADAINSVTFSGNDALAVTTSNDRTIRVWDARTGELRGTLAGGKDRVTGAVFSPDDRLIVATGDDGVARLWRTPIDRPQIRLPELDGVKSISFSADGQFVLLGSSKRSVVASTVTGRLQRTFPMPAKEAALALDGHLFAGGRAPAATLWDVNTGAHHAVVGPTAAAAVLSNLGPDHRWAAVITPRRVIVLDGRTGRTLYVIRGGRQNHVGRRVSSADGRFVAALRLTHLPTIQVRIESTPVPTERASIDVWNLATRTHVAWRQPHQDTKVFTHIALDRRGRYLAAGTQQGPVWVWRLPSRLQGDLDRPDRVLQTHVPIRALAFSPTSDILATAGEGTSVDLWNPRTGDKLRSLVGHTGWINSVAYSADGQAIVTASDDGSVRVWGAGAGESWAVFRQGSSRKAIDAEFDRSRKRIVVASADGTSAIYACPVCGGLEDVRRFAEQQQPLRR